ncbi:MAG: protein kinase domain-containing protein [Vicinamibacterales bacterium]
MAPLGAGGMGEVYRARDTKLHRDVAIKVLPDLFAADPDRLARFEREAYVLASLNHPTIAQIYGLEESGSTREDRTMLFAAELRIDVPAAETTERP